MHCNRRQFIRRTGQAAVGLGVLRSAAWVEVLFQLVRGRSAADQKRLFADNAIRFYGLKSSRAAASR
jgi:hypothetical protein